MTHGVLNLPRNLVLDWTFGHSLINCHVEHHLFPFLSDNMCLKVGNKQNHMNYRCLRSPCVFITLSVCRCFYFLPIISFLVFYVSTWPLSVCLCTYFAALCCWLFVIILFITIFLPTTLQVKPVVSKYLTEKQLPYQEDSYLSRLSLFFHKYQELMVFAPPITELVGVQWWRRNCLDGLVPLLISTSVLLQVWNCNTRRTHWDLCSELWF